MVKSSRKNVSRKNVSRKNNKSKKNGKHVARRSKINKMRGGVLPEEVQEYITRLSKNDPNLKEINIVGQLIIGGQQIDVEGAQALAEALKKNSVLTTLNIRYNNLYHKGAKAIAEALKVNKKLTDLNISRCEINYSGAIYIAKALETNTTLTKLDISNNHINAEALAEALKVNKTLTMLNISKNYIYDGAIDLAEALKVNKTLTELNISETMISHEGAIALAEALKENNTLTTLDISVNEIRGEGATALATALAEALKTNKTLIELQLNYISFNAEALGKFLDVLKYNNKTLRVLGLINGQGITPLIDQINAQLRKNNIQNVSELAVSSFLPHNIIEEYLKAGIQLQEEFITRTKSINYNSKKGAIILTDEETMLDKMLDKMFYKKKHSQKHSQNKDNKHITQFLKKDKSIPKDIKFTMLLYLPLINYLIKKEQLIDKIRDGNTEFLKYYIKAFNEMALEQEKKILPVEIWSLILEYLQPDDIKSFQKALRP